MKISTPDGGRGGPLIRLLVTAAVLAVVLLVAVFFAARTEGARTFVADRLTKNLGTDVTVAKMRIGWPYVLVLHDVRSTAASDRSPGFSAREVRVGLGLRTRWKVAVHRPVVNLLLVSEGGWQPSAFVGLGELPKGRISQVSDLTRNIRSRMRLSVTDGTVRWLKDVGKGVDAMVAGVSLRIAPVKLPGHKAHYYSLNAYSVLPGEDVAHMYDLRREWLVTDAEPYIAICGSGEIADGVHGDFWRNHEPTGRETPSND